jgi:hypothetical protein
MRRANEESVGFNSYSVYTGPTAAASKTKVQLGVLYAGTTLGE